MTKGTLFWVIWVLCFLFGFAYQRGWTADYGPWGFGFIVMALFFLLGWHNFGFVVH